MVALIGPEAVLVLLGVLVASGIVSAAKRLKLPQFLVSSAAFVAIELLSIYMLAGNTGLTLFGALDFYPFSLFFLLLLSVGMQLVNMLSYRHSNDYSSLSMLIAFAFAGMAIVVTASSLLAIFIGLELMSLSTMFMILIGGKSRVEPAVKFFLLSSVSIAAFAFALALAFPYNPSLGLGAIAANANIGGGWLVTLSLIFFAAALAFEAALFPFNLWVPDVYEGAQGNVTAMLAGMNKKVAFAAFMLIFFLVFAAYKSMFSLVFTVLAILTMLFGNMVAMVQTSVKRLFAYSSVSQAGYIMIGLAAATSFGMEASLFQIFAHSFMIIGAFAVVTWLGSMNMNTINDYTGLGGRNGFGAMALTVLMLSMAGIPPLLGFDGKFLLFSSAIGAKLLLLAALGVLNSFLSIYYYAKVINAMFAPRQGKKIRMDPLTMAVVAIALAVIVLLGIYPQPLISLAAAAAKPIVGP